MVKKWVLNYRKLTAFQVLIALKLSCVVKLLIYAVQLKGFLVLVLTVFLQMKYKWLKNFFASVSGRVGYGMRNRVYAQRNKHNEIITFKINQTKMLTIKR